MSSLTWVLVCSGVISALIAFYAVINYGSKSLPMVIGLLGMAVWQATYGIALAWFDPTTRPLFAKFQYFGSAATLFGLLAFTVVFTGYGRYITLRNTLLALFMPLLTIVFVWTNQAHSLIWTSIEPHTQFGLSLLKVRYGPFFWVQLVYNYTMIAFCVLLLLKHYRGSTGLVRSQTGLFLIAILIPFFPNISTIAWLNRVEGLDLTPLGFAGSTVLVAIAVASYKIMDSLGIPLDLVLRDLPDAVMVLDSRNQLLDINPAGARLAGARAESLLGKSLESILPNEFDLLQNLQSTHQTQKEISLGSPAAPEYYSMRVSPIYNWRKSVVGRSLVLRNISELQHSQMALQAAKEQLEQVNAQLTRKVAELEETQQQVLAQQRQLTILDEREQMGRELHDGIGQSLAFFNVGLQTIVYQLENGQKRAVDESLRQMRQMMRIATEDLRAFILGLRPIDHSRSFEDTLRTFIKNNNQLGSTNISLDYPPGLANFPFEAGTETAIFNLLRECLSNIRKHAQAANAWVRFNFSESETLIEITDDGVGYDATVMALEKADGHFGQGIMRERAEKVDGKISVSSEPGKGTQVRIQLPSALPGNAESENDDLRTARGLRIMLVDDHPLFLDGLRNLLQTRGLKVVATANEGAMALKMARELKPDIVVMDLNMPGVDGLETTRAIKNELPKTQVLILTVSDDEDNLFEAVRNGASGYLLKSLNANEFISMLAGISRSETPLSGELATRTLKKLQESRSANPLTDKPDQLTARQWQILKSVATGLLYKQIALMYEISERTVKREMGYVIEALQMQNRDEALLFARAKLRPQEKQSQPAGMDK